MTRIPAMQVRDNRISAFLRRQFFCAAFPFCLGLYFYFVVSPSLIYHIFGRFIIYPQFVCDSTFILKSLTQPAGVITCLAALLSQFYYFDWIGALIIALLCWQLSCAIKILLKAPEALVASSVPVLMIVLIYSRYQHSLSYCLAISASLWMTILFHRLSLKNLLIRVIVFTLFTAVIYYAAGSALLIFLTCVLIIHIHDRQGYLYLLLYPVISLALVWLLTVQFAGWTLENGFILLSPFDPDVLTEPDTVTKYLAASLFFYVPVLLAIFTLLQKRKRTSVVTRDEKRNDRLKEHKNILISVYHNYGKQIKLILLILITTVSAWQCFDKNKKTLINIDYYASKKMWPEVLSTARELKPPVYDIYCNHDVNLALFHTGKLADEMFSFPQKPQSLMLTVPAETMPSRMILKRAQLLAELGDISEAERLFYEFLETRGNCPFVLEQLAMINIAKGQTETARVLLNAMKKDLIGCKRAVELLNMFEQDPLCRNDEQIVQMRRNATEQDYTATKFNADVFFKALLAKNKNNKLAFEYMMAYYLLTSQLDKFVTYIPSLKSLGYTRLPKHYQQALVLHKAFNGPDVDTGGLKIDPQIVIRSRNFDMNYGKYARTNNLKAAFDALKDDYGDSYIFYYVFEISGAK